MRVFEEKNYEKLPIILSATCLFGEIRFGENRFGEKPIRRKPIWRKPFRRKNLSFYFILLNYV